jgi:predicted negative regulator of RcsB-dependent stress response
LKTNYPSTAWTAQASLIIAKQHMSDKNPKGTEDALSWAVLHAADDGVKAIAGLRLAGLYMEQGNFDKSIELLNKTVPADFKALYADRKGDIFLLQKKYEEAVSAYRSAYEALTADIDYRKLIEVKLNGLGIDPSSSKKQDVMASEVKS